MGISLHTCRSYIKNVLAKLDAHSQLEAVATATRVGIVHVPRQR
jgi:DNA-binding CsgD family transcriptional regulator